MMADSQREVPVQRANWGFGALHLDDPERRRIRGVAPQSVFVAFLLFAATCARSTSS
jgi:hypothetical protein